MLDLDSHLWVELRHAYGSAREVPSWLRSLSVSSSSSGTAEPWFSIWSALAHQGDVYVATIAAVPHIIDTLAADPENADDAFFHFPAWVEICRQRSRLEVPTALWSAYLAALARLPRCIAEAASKPWSPDRLACCMAALAAAKGSADLAEAALELTPESVPSFLAWFQAQ